MKRARDSVRVDQRPNDVTVWTHDDRMTSAYPLMEDPEYLVYDKDDEESDEESDELGNPEEPSVEKEKPDVKKSLFKKKPNFKQPVSKTLSRGLVMTPFHQFQSLMVLRSSFSLARKQLPLPAKLCNHTDLLEARTLDSCNNLTRNLLCHL